MKCRNAKLHIEIPIEVNSNGSSPYYTSKYFKDENGITYELAAIKDAARYATEDKDIIPIMLQIGSKDEKIEIGSANLIKWNKDGYIEVDGVLNFISTISDEYIFSSDKDIIDFTISEIIIGILKDKCI